MKYIKYILLVFVLLVAIYTGYKYFIYKKFFDYDKLEKLSEDLSIPVFNYVTQYENKEVTSSGGFNNMISWVNETYFDISGMDEIMSYGYEIKHHKESNYYLFCLYGEDGRVSKKNISVGDLLDRNKVFSEKKPPFFKYLPSSKDYDIILFGYKKPTNNTKPHKRIRPPR
ncbi:MAG: hypothetical protein ACPG6G_00665 [Flavobacteriaceae bacterium]